MHMCKVRKNAAPPPLISPNLCQQDKVMPMKMPEMIDATAARRPTFHNILLQTQEGSKLQGHKVNAISDHSWDRGCSEKQGEISLSLCYCSN